MHAEVGAHERGQPGDVLIKDGVALGAEGRDGGVEVDGVPQDYAVQDEAEDAELVLQTAFVAVEQFALLAVADGAGQVVAAFLEVADGFDVTAVVSSVSM